MPLKNLTEENIRNLRDVRLHHWLEHKKLFEIARNQNLDSLKQNTAFSAAHHHLKYVQHLNILFETGDTAEKDEQIFIKNG